MGEPCKTSCRQSDLGGLDPLQDALVEIVRLRGLLAEINTTARVPTPQGMRAYTHFQRDFDKIRALSASPARDTQEVGG